MGIFSNDLTQEYKSLKGQVEWLSSTVTRLENLVRKQQRELLIAIPQKSSQYPFNISIKDLLSSLVKRSNLEFFYLNEEERDKILVIKSKEVPDGTTSD